ncbi:uncharacterized protein [Montipora capricornis]|uniref:uncharacterized protein isoform X1 n=1 Tax=Montipora capricornis TaxID=246305 RepID=UPI0035F1E905
MADKSSWELLVHISERLFGSLFPLIIPAKYQTRKVLQAMQKGLKKRTELGGSALVHCEWCQRAIINNNDQSKVGENRILTWNLDWSKMILIIKGVQVCCEECNLMLDLGKLLNFLVMSDESTEATKLYPLASHFCQVNGHTSQSGEDDIKLLQQAASIAYSLHVLTKNVPDFTIQAPNGDIISLESVDELLKSLLPQADFGSGVRPTIKAKRKKSKEESSTKDPIHSQISQSSSKTKVKSDTKRKKKKLTQDALSNGHHNCDGEEIEECEDTVRKQLVFSEKKRDVSGTEENEESEDPVRKKLVFSEKKKKVYDTKIRAKSKKRRTVP